MKYIVVFITAPSQKEAEKIAGGLLGLGLAACISIIPRIKSLFIWQGKKEIAEECLLIVKTRKDKFNALKKAVKRVHSYDIPEIIAIPVSEGDKGYLKWIGQVLK